MSYSLFNYSDVLMCIVAGLVGFVVLLLLVWGLSVWRLSILAGRRLPHILELTENLTYEEALQNKEYRSWVSALQKFCILYVKPFEAAAERRYVRVNEFLIYEPSTTDDGRKVAKLHIRSKKANELHKLMSTKDLLEGFTATVHNLLADGVVDIVQGISHNRLLSPTIIDKMLRPRLEAQGHKIEVREMDTSFLPWIYCDFLQVYGMDWFETIQGYTTFKRMRTAIEIKVSN